MPPRHATSDKLMMFSRSFGLSLCRLCASRVDSRCGAVKNNLVQHELILDDDILSRLQVSKSRLLPVECHRYRDRHRGHEQRIPVNVPQHISRGGSWWAVEWLVREERNFTVFRTDLDFSGNGESA